MNNFPRTPHLVSATKSRAYHGYVSPSASAHDFWIDGYPVIEKLHEFCTAYRKASPHVKFFASYGHNDHVDHVYKDLFVYADSSEYVMGRIMFNHDEGGYGVSSHKISNDRFNAGKDGHYCLWSSDLKRAVKNANAYIGAWPLDVIAYRSVNSFSGRIRRVVDAASFKLNGIGRIDALTLAHEVLNLSRQGVQFLSAEVQEFANQAQSYIDEYNRLKKYNGDAVFVSIRILKNGKQIADIGHANLNNLNRDNMVFKSELVDSLDPDFAGKLAALTLVDIGTYVENIGLRVTEQSFWVECRDV